MKKKITYRLKRKQKQAAKNSKFLLRHPLLVPVTTFMVLFFVGMAAFVSLGATTQGASDAHIVNIFVDGEQRTVTTRAKTVNELLDRLPEIKLLDEDIVEPARESLILEDDVHVNIYKARSVELVDGDRILTLFTAQRAPRLVAIDAGLDLYPEDEATFTPVESTVLESTATEQLSIKRSIEIKLNLYGAIKTLRTTADSVEELLEKQQITPAENELVQPSLETAISSDLLVSVNKPGIKSVIITEKIKYETITNDDSSIIAGETRVQTKGLFGEKATIYEIDEDEEGKELSRKEIQSVVLKKPVAEVVLIGTKIVAPYFNPSTNVSGDKIALMSAAGISASDYAFVDFIVNHESTWRPGAVNSSSGAYGLCQSLPASKMATAGPDYLTNPVTQLRWCSSYAVGRYGSWSGAYGAWLAQGWW